MLLDRKRYDMSVAELIGGQFKKGDNDNMSVAELFSRHSGEMF